MCGVIGVIGTPLASSLTAVGLHALQHRGQEAAGIISYDGDMFHEYREGGLVEHIFSKDVFQSLGGHVAIGHVRYSTAGQKHENPALQKRDAQPIMGYFPFGGLAIAHNGNLTNYKKLRYELLRAGHSFATEIDTEIALKLIGSAPRETLVERMQIALPQLEGAYAFVMLTRKKLIGVCDPLSIRPLVLGRSGNVYVFASETCALDALQMKCVREVEQGEIVVIENGKVTSHRFAEKRSPKRCIFESVYFSRPDSEQQGESIYLKRKALGRELAREAPVEHADIVVPVPDSGVPHALGFSEHAGIPFEHAIVRNHYVGRTFIDTPDVRGKKVILKHSPIKKLIRGKRIVLIDDSLVRSTTASRVVKRLFDDGALEVHLRIASPPWRVPCRWGIDTQEPKELVASEGMSIEEICNTVKEKTGANSVAYLSVDGLHRAVHGEPRNNECPQSCDACFTGDRPTSVTDDLVNFVNESIH